MFLHISHAVKAVSISRVVLWSIYSDVTAMFPRYCLLMDITEFFMWTGVRKRKRYTFAQDVGEDISMVLLPAIHVLSGCDSRSSKNQW